jgi:HD-GYP domain-containing protein (c-di-GMP phosphodiesterase class II)
MNLRVSLHSNRATIGHERPILAHLAIADTEVGHSQACPGPAARLWRLSDADVAAVRRAGLLHDLGRLGVSNTIWDKPGRLSGSELEHVRILPYLTERMLAGVSALAAGREVAGRHHERLDGSGYPRGLTAPSLRPLDRLLAVTDA